MSVPALVTTVIAFLRLAAKGGWHARRRAAERLLRLSVVLTGTALLLTGCVHEPLTNLHDNLSFLDPQGPIAAAERWHFWFVVGIMGVFVATPVYLLTIWLVWHYRYKNKANTRYAPKWGDNRLLSIATWGGPVVIVVVLGVFAWRNTHRLNPWTSIASNQPTLPVEAIGYDWKWLFIYPKQKIATIGVLPVPVGRPIAMKLTSATVMQSLWIPALVGQIYAMGGMTTQLHFEATNPGRSLGLNTMYNGAGFHQQKFTAVAMKPQAFKAWVEHVKATGLRLDGRAYALISAQNTKDQLASALRLPEKEVRTEAISMRDVPARLFQRVLIATRQGTTVNVNANASASLRTTLSASLRMSDGGESALATPQTEQ